MRQLWALLLVVATMALCSCGDGASSMLPKSGGRPYEVLITSNDTAAGLVVDSVLSQDATCLPQPEPEFDTSLIDSTGLNGITRLARCIVKITVNPKLFTKTRIRYDKNVWARQQLVVYINTPSAETLKRDMRASGRRLIGLLVRSEMNNAISSLTASRNTAADSMVKATAGLGMRVPADMKSSKKGRNFIWLSNNAASGMVNICVYTYPGTDLSGGHFITMRDSVMRINIPGEHDGMYLATVRDEVLFKTEKIRHRNVMIASGLWEMRNDAMGGPFVAHAVVDSVDKKVVVAEAFVYAPEMKKRNLIRRAEAALYTLD